MKNLTILAASIVLAACCNTKTVAPVGAELFQTSAFDTTLNGKAVSLYTLQNANGMAVQLTNFGARIVDLWVPSVDSTFKDVVWGYENIDGYLETTDNFCGPIVGRYGNRIGKGEFEIDGKKYKLDINDGVNHLHGGSGGVWNKVWDATQGKDSLGNPTIEMSYLSADGEQGYPGNLSIKVTYTLTANNELAIDYIATTDRPTIVNLTSHAYFNLHGTSEKSTNTHLLTINADNFTPTDKGLIPTGEITSVEGTPLDFRQPMAIGARLDTLIYEPMIFGGGYDHNWILNHEHGVVAQVAELYEPETGIVMKIFTDQPGLQFYSGNGMDPTQIGKRGDKHNRHSGIALETQNYPDAPNHANFPNSVLRPGETYTHKAVYGFEVR